LLRILLLRFGALSIGKEFKKSPLAVRTRTGVESYVIGFGHLAGRKQRIVLGAIRNVMAEPVKYQEAFISPVQPQIPAAPF